MLIVKPTDDIVRGFVLDTTPHKDKMKLLRVVLPLYCPSQQFSLNYSQMIVGDHAALFHVDRKAYDESAEIIFERIAPHIEALRKLRGPAEFLDYIAWMSGNRMMSVRMDFGLTHIMLGNDREALAIFNQMDADLKEFSQSIQEHCRPTIRRLLHLLEHDRQALRGVLEGWRDEKIKRWGLAASIAGPPLHIVQ